MRFACCYCGTRDRGYGTARACHRLRVWLRAGYAAPDLHWAARKHVNALSRWANTSKDDDEQRFRLEAFNAAALMQAERDIRRREGLSKVIV